ncbi:amidase [Solimonas flava]|uniref:amidase n=1 Tax=Solimonas flava TaxID=415849 RepID=UPI0003FBCB2A|nr:amidase [Solimonas flava]
MPAISSSAARVSRRVFLRGAASAAALAASSRVSAKAVARVAADVDSDEILYMSASKLAGLLRARQLSALEVVDAYIARQLAIDDRLNAVVMSCYERARAEALALDQRAARGDFAGALHGVPMTIKDSFDTEGVISTGGTYGRQQYVPPRDATVVRRLRAQGAILLGKTNTPEFTVGGVGAINTTSNMLYGSTHNPYDLTRTASGSSGGAGANVAAGGAAFDVGSDIGGSLRLPAHVNGVAGLKTTAGRVPRTGHIVDYGGVLDSWQQIGPLARRVKDLALIAPLISGPDFRDAACVPIAWADPDGVDLAALKVVFWPENGLSKVDADTQRLIRQAAAWLGEVAADVRQDCPTADLAVLHEMRGKLSMGDGWAWYQRLAQKWGTHHLSGTMDESIRAIKPLRSSEFVEAWEQSDAAKSRLLGWFAQYDVLLCPVAGEPATPIDWDPSVPGDYRGMLSDVGVFNSTGWPVVVVRCGASADGRLPIGIQVVAPPWREDVALAVARYIEGRSGGWTRPPL